MYTQRLISVVLFLIAGTLTGCATASPGLTQRGVAAAPSFEGQHPLVGRLVETEGLQVVEPSTLLSAARGHRHVLLGEHHDNPHHHLGQAWIISALSTTHSHVVFEMVETESLARAISEGEDVSERWAASGWPIPEAYRPIFEAIAGGGLSAHAGLPERTRVKGVVKGRLGSLDADERRSLLLAKPLPEATFSSLRKEMVAAHCGHDHPYIDGMVDAQRFKDAWMGRVMREAVGSSLLIAGKGHTRRDRGVPAFVRDEALVVHFVEVRSESPDIADYPSDIAQADFIWFTPPVDRGDPCAMFRKAPRVKKPDPQKTHDREDSY